MREGCSIHTDDLRVLNERLAVGSGDRFTIAADRVQAITPCERPGARSSSSSTAMRLWPSADDLTGALLGKPSDERLPGGRLRRGESLWNGS